MKFDYKEIDLIDKDIKRAYYGVPAVGYSIELYRVNLSKAEFNALSRMFRYYCQKDHVSFLLIYSTTDSATAQPIYQQHGERGRPIKIVEGTKVLPHQHNLVIGNENTSAFSTAQKIQKYLNKQYGQHSTRVISRGSDYHFFNSVGYLYNQADIIRSYGDFDFKGYYDSRL